MLYAQAQDGGMIPCAFGLLSSKTKVLYKKFWSCVQEALGPAVYPETILMDMEQGAIRAFEEVFIRLQGEEEDREISIQFYLFHFQRAILDELAKKKCKPEMETNPLFNRIYNLVRRLPFVHYDHVRLVANTCIHALLSGNEDGISDQAYQWINYIKTFYTGYFDPGRNRWIEPRFHPKF